VGTTIIVFTMLDCSRDQGVEQRDRVAWDRRLRRGMLLAGWKLLIQATFKVLHFEREQPL